MIDIKYFGAQEKEKGDKMGTVTPTLSQQHVLYYAEARKI